MATHTWIIVDPDYTPAQDFQIDGADFGRAKEEFSIERRTLHGGLCDGVVTVKVSSGPFSFVVVPTRGMGIWKAWLGHHEFGWKSPVHGPVHPKFVPITDPTGLGWLDGFDELFVRCGLESNGAPEFDATTGRLTHPLHGRIANKPAKSCEVVWDDDARELTITGVVEEARFHITKLRLRTTMTLKLGEPSVTIRDELENYSALPATAQMLYHINFGIPLLDAGARVVAPAKQIVPRNAHAAEDLMSWDSYSAEQPGFEEQVYFFELLGDKTGATQVLLKNAHGTLGTSIHFNTQQLPCFSLWKDTAAGADGYVTGLEPGTNFPNPRSFETKHDRVMKLAPGEKKTLEVRLELHGDADSVSAAEKSIAALQGGTSPTVHPQPLADWCA